MTKLQALGDIVFAQAFADFKRVDSEPWSDACERHRIVPHQIAVDIEIVITVLDLVHAYAIDAVAVVSNDTDFRPLARRVRDAGVACYGFGDHRASDRLKDAATASTLSSCWRLRCCLPVGSHRLGPCSSHFADRLC